jgi:hypothetical protein
MQRGKNMQNKKVLVYFDTMNQPNIFGLEEYCNRALTYSAVSKYG